MIFTNLLLIVVGGLSSFTLWKVFTMSNNTDAADALEAAASRLVATMNSASDLIDTLKALPAADDVSARITTVTEALDTANNQLDAVVTANKPAA